MPGKPGTCGIANGHGRFAKKSAGTSPAPASKDVVQSFFFFLPFFFFLSFFLDLSFFG